MERNRAFLTNDLLAEAVLATNAGGVFVAYRADVELLVQVPPLCCDHLVEILVSISQEKFQRRVLCGYYIVVNNALHADDMIENSLSYRIVSRAPW